MVEPPPEAACRNHCGGDFDTPASRATQSAGHTRARREHPAGLLIQLAGVDLGDAIAELLQQAVTLVASLGLQDGIGHRRRS